MVVYLNNKEVELSGSKSITEVVNDDLKYTNPRGIAVAVNQEVVPKTDWNKFLIKENDRVTVIKATQGG